MHNENIDNILYQEMDNSDFGIFELTSENKNVYYETGYLDGKGKQTILIVKAGTKIPFDLDHKSRVIYNDLNDLKQKLYEKIEHIKNKIY